MAIVVMKGRCRSKEPSSFDMLPKEKVVGKITLRELKM